MHSVGAETQDEDELQSKEIEDIVEHVANGSAELESIARTFMESYVEDETEELFDLDLLLESLDESQCFVGDPPEDFDYKAFKARL